MYNMLREEIRRMQVEINQRSDHIVALKKQIEKSEKSYKQKCNEVDLLIKDNSEIILKRDTYKADCQRLAE